MLETSPKKPDARSLHQAAEQAREAKRYVEALSLYDQALMAYIETEDLVGVSELHAARSIVYRHLADQAKTPTAKTAWLAEVETEVARAVKAAELAQTKGLPTGMALALFNQAKYYDMVGDFSQAIPLFTQAIEWLQKAPPITQDRPSVLWDFKLKLAIAQLESGKSEALSEVLAALEALAQDTSSDADYNTKVWRSGGYLRLASYYAKIDLAEAKKYLAQAETIANGDSRMIIRQQECRELATKLA